MNDSFGVMRDKIFMCYQNYCLTFPVKLVKKLQNAVAGFAVEIARRFIGQQNARITDKRPGDSYSLFLTSGKLVGSMFYTVSQSNPLKDVLSTFAPGPPAVF
jgi:hypothetical protein